MNRFAATAAFFCWLISGAFAQDFSDNFNDGSFLSDPVWSGNTSFYSVNAAGELQLQGDCVAGGEHYLSTEVSLADTATWEFYLRLEFDPSSSNQARFYLQSDQADLTGSLNGYYLRIGEDGTSDALKLYRQNGSSSTLLLSGTSGAVATSPELRVKVVKTTSGEWQLWADYSGGSAFAEEGSVVDVFPMSAFYTGVFCDYTSTRCTSFFWDDVLAGPLYVDTDPPGLISCLPSNASQVQVLFTETLNAATATSTSNYVVDGGVGSPLDASLEATGNSTLLTFAEELPQAVLLTMEVGGLQDLAGNTLSFSTCSFTYYEVQTYDVVINEIMADPAPVVGLPEEEYVEIYNTSDFDIDLTGWFLSDATDSSDAFTTYILNPDQYLLLCDLDQVSLFEPYGSVLGVDGFPSLNNDGDSLRLYRTDGTVIHEVFYTDSWYNNAIKEEGGYSLEMIDPLNPCQGSENWSASNALTGGTPATVNSILASNPDETPPMLLQVFPLNPNTVLATFDEAIDVSSLSVSNFIILPDIGTPASVNPDLNQAQNVLILLGESLEIGTLYTLSCESVADCSGNVIVLGNEKSFGIPEVALPGDVVINEVLFNPATGGVDFVEVVNKSNKLLDLSAIRLVEYQVDDTTLIDEFTLLSDKQALLLPNEYWVICEDPEVLSAQYVINNQAWIEASANMPNFPDDEGILTLEDLALNRLDRLQYTDDWHYALLDDENGVSLERLNINLPTQDPENWHSAAADAGFATPGKQNSVVSEFNGGSGVFSLESDVVTPDGDGMFDVMVMYYTLPQPGYSANITVFDLKGRPVTTLANNLFLSTEGVISWDGLTQQNEEAPMGIYFIFIEMFRLDGTVERHKLKCTLARKK